MEVLAVEGSFASVIGGAPAAAVVFTRDVDERTQRDPRVQAAEAAVTAASFDDAGARRAELAAIRDTVRTEKLGEVAAEFDAVHSVERARQVGLGAPHHRGGGAAPGADRGRPARDGARRRRTVTPWTWGSRPSSPATAGTA